LKNLSGTFAVTEKQSRANSNSRRKKMINKKMEDALNQQINEEMYSAYLYLAMVHYFEKMNLKGFAHWFMTQVQEEMLHTMKFRKYIADRGGEVTLKAINEPDHSWESPLALCDAALHHEFHITKCINDLMDLAIAEKDHATRSLLNWYVDEQVEEEDNFTQLVEKLKMIEDNKSMLLIMDTEMQQRMPGLNPFFPPPAPAPAA